MIVERKCENRWVVFIIPMDPHVACLMSNTLIRSWLLAGWRAPAIAPCNRPLIFAPVAASFPTLFAMDEVDALGLGDVSH